MPWLVAVALLVVPIVEIFVIIQVGQVIGGWPTVGLLLLESALGAWLVKREGRRAWTALNTSMQTGRMPGRELADAALVLVGGTLLLTPGFVTDVVGFVFILPFTRPFARRLLSGLVGRRLVAKLGGNPVTGFMPGTFRPPPPDGGTTTGGTTTGGPATGGQVVEGQVVDGDGDAVDPDKR